MCRLLQNRSGELNLRFLTCAKCILPFNERIISGKSFFKVCSIRTGTESNAVMHIVNHFHHTKYILLINDNSRQTENAPSWVIGVNCHFISYLLHTGIILSRKYFKFSKAFHRQHPYTFQKLFYFFHSLRFPTRHNSAVHIL